MSHGYTNESHSILVKLGLTVEQFAEVLGLSIQEVSKIIGSSVCVMQWRGVIRDGTVI